MCGLTGVLLPRPAGEDEKRIIENMNGCLGHRGPDAVGFWSDPDAGLLLGHRRLAIMDLTEAGAQPMVSASGRYVIAYNGEVYNFGIIGRELEAEGFKFRGHSDTEVMLAAIEHWGLEKALGRFVGMFAFALWDRELRRLSLVRDRMGIKPLFYCYLSGGGIAFASELKALKAHPGFDGELRRDVLPSYLRYNYIPDPWTIYRSAFKLKPATVLSLDRDSSVLQTGAAGPLAGQVYWDAREAALRGIASPSALSDEEAVEGLEEVLGRAVSDRLIADVPLGAFLSGGVDSSAVVSLMRESASGTVKTFSIGFAEGQFNEADHAREVARHLDTDHTELFVSPAEAMELIPRLPAMYDEPYSDYSNIPTYLVSALARRSVTVSLSGDGGDELFGGYNRHMLLPRLWGRMSRVPAPLRGAAAKLLLSRAPESWDRLGRLLGRGAGGRMPGDFGYKLHKLADSLKVSSAAQLYHSLVSEWKEPGDVLLPGAGRFADGGAGSDVEDDPAWEQFPGLSEASMFLDQIHYLPDDILTKLDRASMAVSLESRVPILDHRVVEYAWSIPLELKIRGGVGKLPLRNLLYKRVPRELIERPKQGFTVPVGLWLRGPLKGWAEGLLDPQSLKAEGFFRPEAVGALWAEHQSGRRNHDGRLWPLLMFQAWLEAEG